MSEVPHAALELGANAVTTLGRERGQLEYANKLRTVDCRRAWNKAWQGLADITASD